MPHKLGLNSAQISFFSLLGVSLGLNAVLWYLSKAFPKDNAATILHYNTDLGIDFIGDGSQISVLPRLGLILLITNLILGIAVRRAENRVSWLLWLTTPLIQLVLCGALLLLRQING